MECPRHCLHGHSPCCTSRRASHSTVNPQARSAPHLCSPGGAAETDEPRAPLASRGSPETSDPAQLLAPRMEQVLQPGSLLKSAGGGRPSDVCSARLAKRCYGWTVCTTAAQRQDGTLNCLYDVLRVAQRTQQETWPDVLARMTDGAE